MSTAALERIVAVRAEQLTTTSTSQVEAALTPDGSAVAL
jgi:hypothetical protein